MDTDQKVLEMYKKGKDAADKFDYFVCTVAGAVFAYTGQHYSPKPLAIDVSLLEPISLLLLAVSFYCGLKRIELCVTIVHMDKDLTALDPVVGFGPKGRSEQLKTVISHAQAKSKALYIWRDRLLILGFFAIFLAKVLQPYGRDFSPPSTLLLPALNIPTPIMQPAAIPDKMPTQIGQIPTNQPMPQH